MKDSQEVRSFAKQAIVNQFDALKRHAELAGFIIEGKVIDPVEEAVAEESLLVDARSMLENTFREYTELASTLGYNVRVERTLNPLAPRESKIELHIWPMRNADGGYDG